MLFTILMVSTFNFYIKNRSLGNSAEGYEYLHDLHKKVEEDFDDDDVSDCSMMFNIRAAPF